MLNLGKYKILGLDISACDHDFILEEMKSRIERKMNFLVSPLASQTFILALFDKKVKRALLRYEYLFSDSLWVKRTINFLYKIGLRERLRGSNFLLQVACFAQENRYNVYLYGTTSGTLTRLKDKLSRLFPRLNIVGSNPSVFRNLTGDEKRQLIREIGRAKTDILFIALGSPLEQVFSYELLFTKPKFTKPLVIIPFGAAFDFVSGVKPTAPKWMQKFGLEWFFRFLCEPRRLWKRYLIYGPIFISLAVCQKLRILLNLPDDIVLKVKGRN